MPRTDALEWHRRRYGVPARRGMRVTVDGRPGTIIGAAEGGHLKVRFDGPYYPDSGRRRIYSCHPVWRVEYQEEACGGGDTGTGEAGRDDGEG